MIESTEQTKAKTRRIMRLQAYDDMEKHGRHDMKAFRRKPYEVKSINKAHKKGE